MLNENILDEMTQRTGEKTGKFLTRQQMARNVVRKMNALETRLMHLMMEEEYKGTAGSDVKKMLKK